MTAGAVRAAALGAGLACLVSVTPAWAKPPTVEDRRLSACYDDMVRLCPGEPSKAKLGTCIRPRRARVGQACRAWLDAPR